MGCHGTSSKPNHPPPEHGTLLRQKSYLPWHGKKHRSRTESFQCQVLHYLFDLELMRQKTFTKPTAQTLNLLSASHTCRRPNDFPTPFENSLKAWMTSRLNFSISHHWPTTLPRPNEARPTDDISLGDLPESIPAPQGGYILRWLATCRATIIHTHISLVALEWKEECSDCLEVW